MIEPHELTQSNRKMLIIIHEMGLVGSFEPKCRGRVYILEASRHDGERRIHQMEPTTSSHLFTAILFLIGGKRHLDL